MKLFKSRWYHNLGNMMVLGAVSVFVLLPLTVFFLRGTGYDFSMFTATAIFATITIVSLLGPVLVHLIFFTKDIDRFRKINARRTKNRMVRKFYEVGKRFKADEDSVSDEELNELYQYMYRDNDFRSAVFCRALKTVK